jgi:putative ABC transport system permease protein
MVWVTNPRQGFDRDFTSYPRLLAWRERSELVEACAGYTLRQAVATGLGDPEQLRVVRTTPEFFQVVRTEPVRGRLFAMTEEDAAAVVIGHGLWQRKFGGQASAVGQALRLDSIPHTIRTIAATLQKFSRTDS